MIISTLVQAICARRRQRITTTTYAGRREPGHPGSYGLARPEETCTRSGGRRRSATHFILAGVTLALCAGASVDQRDAETAVLQTELRGVREDISEIKTTMQDLSRAMLVLVRVEQRQIDQQGRLSSQEVETAGHEARLRLIEADVPVLKELRKWVIAGVGAALLALTTALLSGSLQVVYGPRPSAAIASSKS